MKKDESLDPFDDLWEPQEIEDGAAGAPAEDEPSGLRQRLQRWRAPFARLGNAMAWAWQWLRHPDRVGQPITLEPRGVRLLVLLILGNLLVLVLLTAALFRAAATSAADPGLQIVVATPTAGPAATPAPSPTPFGSGGAIAFTLRQDGNADVYALNQADRQLVRLTHHAAEDRDPAWSPDGNYVAFTSHRADNWDIYLLDLATGRPIRLTRDPHFDGNPSWSPDGQFIAFESYRYRSLDIFIMDTSGGRVRRITFSSDPEFEPAWSPDSSAIAFTRLHQGNKDIYLYLVEEERTLNLTNSPDVNEDTPSWSPDGTQLAYVSGPLGNPSLQVTTFDWETMAVDQAHTELFGAGASPAWAPDGQTLVYVHRRAGLSYLTAASLAGWGQFHEVYSTHGLVDDLAWTTLSLSPRVIAQARANAPAVEVPLYIELVQPTPTAGPPYSLLPLSGVTVQESGEEPSSETPGQQDEEEENDEENGEEIADGDVESPATEEPEETREPEEEPGQPAYLSDRVNDSFNHLRQRVIQEAGWDYLSDLGLAQLPTDFTPYSGHSRMSWHVCGRAFGLSQAPYSATPPLVQLAREDVGNVTYWRVYLRAAEQDGSMGEPLREAVWNLAAREEDGRAMVEGGKLEARPPSGYYVDFTTLASDYGWDRVEALWRWRYFWPDTRWWRFRKVEDLTWWECMLEVFEPEEIEAAFGPIPGYEE